MNNKLVQDIENIKKLYTEKKYTDVVSILSEVLKESPDYAEGWKYLGSSLFNLKQYQKAIEAYQQALKLNPKDSYSWLELGHQFIEVKDYEQAKKALEKARFYDKDDIWLWRYFARIYKELKEYPNEIKALKYIELLGGSNPDILNRIGIAYHNNKDFFKALDYYHKSFIKYDYSATHPPYNMGLVYKLSEVSQDIDAADSFKRALNIDPNYENAKAELKEVVDRLIPLVSKAKDQFPSLNISNKDHYRFYLNPFEAFGIQTFDIKTIRRARKVLISEIELNNSHVSWLSNQIIDKAKVYQLEEEILDENKKKYHQIIYEDKKILNFLSKGSIDLFLYDETYLPETIIKARESDEGFRIFLSAAFVGAYDFVLSQAIDKKAIAVIKSMFNGRRWVIQNDMDKCYAGTQKWVNKVLSDFNNVSIEDLSCEGIYQWVDKYLKDYSVVEIFNMLPLEFQDLKTALIEKIRMFGVNAYNKQNESGPSRKLLDFCKLFRVRNPQLLDNLNKDYKAIGDIVKKEENAIAYENENKKHCISLLIKSNSTLIINKEEVRYRDSVLRMPDIENIRCKSSAIYVNGTRKCSYRFVLKGRDTVIDVEFSTNNLIGVVSNFFRSSSDIVPLESSSNEEQRAACDLIFGSIHRFAFPSVISKLVKIIESGNSCLIGHCTLSQSGIGFNTGIVYSNKQTLPWKEAAVSIDNGQVIVKSETNSKIKTVFNVGDTDNAMLFPIICKMMKEKE